MSSFLKYCLGGLLFADLVFINFSLIKLLKTPQKSEPKSVAVSLPTKAINTPTLPPPAAVSVVPTKAPLPHTPPIKTKTVSYIPIPGSGSILNTKWTDISGTEFNINTDDYPNIVDTRFEANMKLLNGNGKAYLRLFDSTVGIEVWGSQIETGSQNFTFVTSDEIFIRPGNHLYKLQAKSLTADTTVLNSARIKIISEN